jgi:hypothetical protein
LAVVSTVEELEAVDAADAVLWCPANRRDN